MENSFTFHTFLVVLTLSRICEAQNVHGSSVTDELYLTNQSQILFDQFKEYALGSGTIKLDIYKKDVNLVKYFKSADMDLEKAKTLFQNVQQLRRNYSLDSILDENFTNWKQNFPYELGVDFDKENRPVLFVQGGRWDFCKYVATNKTEILRYWLMVWEHGARAALKRPEDGFDVARFLLLNDLQGIDLNSTANSTCENFYLEVMPLLDAIWPRILHKLIYVNVPGGLTLLDKMKPLMAEETQGNFLSLGGNAVMWKPILLKFITPDQLPKQLYMGEGT